MKAKIFVIVILKAAICIASPPDNLYVKDREDAILEVIYNRKAITDTTRREESFTIDDIMLRIGKTKSLFCGVKKLWADSISTVDFISYSYMLRATYEKDKDNFFFLGGRYWSYIYKDLLNKEVTECDYFDMTHWRYKEEMKIPSWNILDSITNIAGYECLMATAYFKGRRWVAWFSPEIPISDGPWKLCGLPGLILSAYDDARDYEFTVKSIRTSGLGLVGFMYYRPEEDYVTVTREKFFKSWQKYKHGRASDRIKAAYGITTPALSSPKKTVHYDREETDYEHN